MIYDNLSDSELLRFADAHYADPLIKALTERLEMRLRDLDELEHLLGRKAPQPIPTDAQLTFNF
jgi:hypothetical protein